MTDRPRPRSRANMLTRFICAALDHRLAVLAGAVLIAVGGYVGLSNINVDACPDTTPVQVQISSCASVSPYLGGIEFTIPPSDWPRSGRGTPTSGGDIDRREDMLLIHGIARTATVEQIGDIVVTARDGTPVYVKDLGQVVIAHDVRRGVVTADGGGEVILGLGFMRIGSNSYTVTREMSEQLDRAVKELPPGSRSRRCTTGRNWSTT